jgi:lipoate-protein ligase A
LETWRLIIDPALDGPENMAVDEAILAGARIGAAAAPTLRFYGWATPTISVGYLQDAAPFTSFGLPVVRRITGGRAVLHDMELTYSVAASRGSAVFSGGIASAYAMISKAIIAALADVGIDANFSATDRSLKRHKSGACFHSPSRYEILAGGRKLVGSSQRRYKDAFLQHGSILYDLDAGLNERVFGEELMDRVTCIKALNRVKIEELREAITLRMAESFNAAFSVQPLTPSERSLCEELVAEKYSSRGWNLYRGRANLNIDMVEYGT